MKKRFFIGAALFFLCAVQAPAQEKPRSLLVEVSSTRLEWGNETPIILMTFTNSGTSTLSAFLPYDWYGLAPDAFAVYQDNRELPNPYAFSTHSYNRKTQLNPGERVTFAFHLKRITKLPDKETRKGRYKVKLLDYLPDGDRLEVVNGKPALFWIGDTVPTDELGLDRIATREHEAKAIALLQTRNLTPYDKLQLLRLAAKSSERATLWRVIGATDDAYAISELLRDLPPGLAEREGLTRLLKAVDLSIRRSAIQTMAKLGRDSVAAASLEAFMKTQNDEPILDYCKQTLKVLRGD